MSEPDELALSDDVCEVSVSVFGARSADDSVVENVCDCPLTFSHMSD